MRRVSLAILLVTKALYGESISTEDYEIASYCLPSRPVIDEKVEIKENVVIKEKCLKAEGDKFSPRDIRVADPKFTFSGYFTASYVQPLVTNAHYAAEAIPLPLPTPNWVINEINPCFHVAYDVGVVGIIHSSQSYVKLNWRHLCSFDSSTVYVPESDMLGPFFSIGPDASPYSTATGKVNYYLQEGTVNYGTPIEVGSKLLAELYMGVNYAYISQKLEYFYANSSEEISRSIFTPSTFSGAGPQIGTTLAFHLIDGLDLVMGAAGSLMYGPVSNGTKYESTSPLLSGLDITAPNTQTTTMASRNQLVPSFDGQAGIAYTQAFCKCSKVAIEAGFRAQVYLGALQSVDMGSEVPLDSIYASTVGVYARTFQKNISNLALAGPYLSIALQF